jgi:transcriptional regulator NrdR family protein
MVCIYCQSRTQVSNSRHQKRNNTIWRRRACLACNAIFTTLEQAELRSVIMVKSAAGLQPLERDTLLISVYESCKHRQRALEEASGLTNTIIGDTLKQVAPDGTIEQEMLHTIIRTVLERFDPAAATIYTAYRK